MLASLFRSRRVRPMSYGCVGRSKRSASTASARGLETFRAMSGPVYTVTNITAMLTAKLCQIRWLDPQRGRPPKVSGTSGAGTSGAAKRPPAGDAGQLRETCRTSLPPESGRGSGRGEPFLPESLDAVQELPLRARRALHCRRRRLERGATLQAP